MVITNYCSRMVAEYYELVARLERAMKQHSEYCCDVYPTEESQLLGEQIIAMTSYVRALEARMNYYKIPYRNLEADCSGGYEDE